MLNKDVPNPVRVLDFLTWYSREGARLGFLELSFFESLHGALFLLLLELLDVLR